MRALAMTLLFTLACATIAWAQLDSGLVAYYPFNGNSNDESGNNRNLTNYGATLTADRFGNANSAYSFDGVTSYLQANAYPALLTTFTYSAWIKVTVAGPSRNYSFGTYGAEDEWLSTWGVGYNPFGHFIAVYDRTNDAWMPTLDIGNQWAHVVIVYASTTRSIYINGAFFASQNITTPIISPPSNDLRIGRHTNNGTQEFQGMIDDIRLYNRALSAEEINRLYHELCGTVSGTLTAANSPYRVVCDLLVPAGDTLVIEPGVRLQFMGPYKFEVRGTLLAEGTATDSIVFTTDTLANPGRWRGLRFLGGSGSRLEYCVLENGRAEGATWNEANGGGAYCIASPSFGHCTFRRNSAQHGGGGVFCYTTSGVVLSHCYFFDNRADCCGGGAGFQNGAQGTLDHCVFAGNTAGQFGGGVYHSYSSPHFQYSTFSANNSPQGGALYCDGSSPPVNSCILWQDATPEIFAVMGSNPPVSYSDVAGGWSGIGNINANPLFVNAAARDFHLTPTSPCIDAGNPAILDPDCTPSDMGAFYFYHLPQPDSLVVQRQGWNMHLAWSVVDSTECGHPTPIRSYAVFFKQVFTETWNFLAATPDTFYVHENVVRFAPSMYYEVIATDIDVAHISEIAHEGMTKEEFEFALGRLAR